MMDDYPSKILLFGEYTIIKNSSALAIPFAQYKSFWSDASIQQIDFEHTIDANFSKNSLLQIIEDLKKLKKPKIALQRLKKNLEEGLWICSNIPLGYGLGSSGAVSAAIYDRYVNKKTDNLTQLKQDLARIEHSFHGKSSGIDPLIAYTNAPLWVHQDKKIEAVNLPKQLNEGCFFLVDSKKARNSAELIHFFMQECTKEPFEKDFLKPMKVAVEKSIEALIEQDCSTIKQQMAIITALQFMYLPPMIPRSMTNLWMTGIESQDFYLKLCGAGGGGFALGFTQDWEATKVHLYGFDYQKIL